jgi:hypothetical protein
MNGRILDGANNAVQWYCAPEMGQIEAISASERARASVPVSDRTMPQTRAEGPPFIRPGVKPLATDSQDASKVTERARIDNESNFLYRLGLAIWTFCGRGHRRTSSFRFPLDPVEWTPYDRPTSDLL